MTIQSFSGVHPWHPTLLLDTDAHDEGNADDIIWNIEHGRCPRCEGPLPVMPEYPAGSRITKCRSIPICGPCGSDEVYEQLGDGLSSGGAWPLPPSEIKARLAKYEGAARAALASGDLLIAADGAMPIANPRNTGGWAQYGIPEER